MPDTVYKPGPTRPRLTDLELEQLAVESRAVDQLLAEVASLKEELALTAHRPVIDIRVGDTWWLPRNTKHKDKGVVKIALINGERNRVELEGGGWNPLDTFLDGWFLVGREYVPGETPMPDVDPKEFHRRPKM